ncbi:IS110 family transposase [Leisingera caerulea]|uniref:IS110 family transposase n=1 Tax=Leisingera caerulea TaxID=506591 RepID=UPI0021A6B63B|nr:IS110 family transposase [Leisingera caerulea]UWQ49922.1 IS110 family transposase [Leisingera caerulea]
MTKVLFAGLDVSLELTSICVVDADGGMILEATAVSDPADISELLARTDGTFERVGFEAGPLSQWLYNGLRSAGLPAVCIEARHAKAAMVAMNRNKNDRNDARSLAQLIRSGWFKPVHIKSTESQEMRTLLMSREFFVNKLRDHENEIRGLLRPFGLKVGRVAARDFEARVRQLVEGCPNLELCMSALLRGRAEMQAQLAELHRALLRLTANDELCRRFMTIPGVGPVTALAFKATIDDPGRFRRSSDVGAHLGLTPRQYQSGETDVRGRISRSGDAFTRTALFTAAHVMLTRSRQWTSIRAWGLRIAKRSNLKKAKVAVARKLAVVMHRMWRDDAPFHWGATT